MMDKTEQFIKMADCPEIQGRRLDFEDESNNDNYMYSGKIIDGGHLVWLPRQDEIQEMMGIKDTSLLVHKFCKFCYRDSIINLMEGGSYLVFRFSMAISMEQLWLNFYMHEKHSKRWSSKEEKWLS